MERLKVIAFTHKSVELADLSRFFIEESARPERLRSIKDAIGAEELFYIATCNRVEFVFVTDKVLDDSYLTAFFKAVSDTYSAEEINWLQEQCVRLQGESALKHLLEVASSLDSLVIGEREIITQVRKSYDDCLAYGLTGDFLRLVMKSVVKSAKEVYTDTRISEKSVSVVFLAYQMLRNQAIKLDARFLIIGAGQTNTTMAKYLLKHGFTNFTVFNRTLANGEKLAADLKGKALPLSGLETYSEGFDVIISCTGSADLIVTNSLYSKLLGEDRGKKILIDLAIPYDIDAEITQNYSTNLITIDSLKVIAEQNMNERAKELVKAEVIINANIEEFKETLKHREVELAMQEVPRKIKEIKHTALNTVFAKEIESLDAQAKEVLERVMDYMEKKYIKVPMLMAKEILIGKE